jgi:hypothetical protein
LVLPRAEMERALESAATEPLAILHADRKHFERQGEARVAAVLAYLGKKRAPSSGSADSTHSAAATDETASSTSPVLFGSGVTAHMAAREGGSNERSISRQLQAYNGQSLFDYISSLRFETATNWLRADPRLEVEVITEWVGLTGWRLRRLCKEWLGHPPTSCRLPTPPFDPKDPATWQLVASGRLPEAEQQELVACARATWRTAYEAAILGEAAPILGTGPAQPTIDSTKPARVVDGDALARSVAEDQLWPMLSGLSYSAQQELVVLYPFKTTALFDLLRQKSRQEGRLDDQRGIELAELARLSLEVSASAFGERIHELPPPSRRATR